MLRRRSAGERGEGDEMRRLRSAQRSLSFGCVVSCCCPVCWGRRCPSSSRAALLWCALSTHSCELACAQPWSECETCRAKL